jgi:rhodanese-related sulfurtransferase
MVSNAGGSLTSAIALTLLAWTVRWVRGELSKRRRHETARRAGFGAPGRFHAALSPAALRMLVETGAQPHVVFDVRPAGGRAEAMPPELRGALRAPPEALGAALASRAAWADAHQGVPFPEPHFLLVFVGATEEQQAAAAAAAAARGFQRTLALAGALPGLACGAPAPPPLLFVGRDAVALLLGAGGRGGPRALVVDVRRSDERALYGAIRGSVHLPVDQLPAALALPPAAFLARHRFPKPRAGDAVVASCRTHTRAAWAARLMADAGLAGALVHRDGVYGWRLDASVAPYRGYAAGDAPPEPEPFSVEAADLGAGAAELEALGVLAG